MAREQVEAGSKEEVLTALGSAALRACARSWANRSRRCSEFDVPLPRATTPSLEALHAYALALDAGRRLIRASRRFRTCSAPSSSIPTSRWRWRRSRASTPTRARRALAPVYSQARVRAARPRQRARALSSSRGATTATRCRTGRRRSSWRGPGRRPTRARRSPSTRSASPPSSTACAPRPRRRCARRSSSTRRSCAPKGNLGDNLMRQNKLDEAMTLVTQSMASGVEYQALYRVGYLVSLLRGRSGGHGRLPGRRAQDARRARRRQLGGAHGRRTTAG